MTQTRLEPPSAVIKAAMVLEVVSKSYDLDAVAVALSPQHTPQVVQI